MGRIAGAFRFREPRAMLSRKAPRIAAITRGDAIIILIDTASHFAPFVFAEKLSGFATSAVRVREPFPRWPAIASHPALDSCGQSDLGGAPNRGQLLASAGDGSAGCEPLISRHLAPVNAYSRLPQEWTTSRQTDKTERKHLLTRGVEPPRVSPYGPEPYASAIPPRELMRESGC
jgi:hypothetical protein